MTPVKVLDQIIERAIPIDPGACRIIRAQKEALRLQTKRDLIAFVHELLKLQKEADTSPHKINYLESN